jgi:hypothetical protein
MSDDYLRITPRSIYLADPESQNPFFTVTRFVPDRAFLPFFEEVRIAEVPLTWEIKSRTNTIFADFISLGESFLIPTAGSFPDWLRTLNFHEVVSLGDTINQGVSSDKGYQSDDRVDLSEIFLVANVTSRSNEVILTDSLEINETSISEFLERTSGFGGNLNDNLTLSEEFIILTTNSSRNQLSFTEGLVLSEIPVLNDLRLISTTARILNFIDGINLIEGNN